MRRTIVLLILAACGRIGFAPSTLEDGGADDAPVDAAPATSCLTLADTCGPSRNEACCRSAVIPGGTFLRGFDHALDMMYADMSSPATLRPFRLDRFEVTVGRFRQFVLAGMATQARPPDPGAGGRTLNGLTDQGGWDPAWNTNLLPDTNALTAALGSCDAYGTWTDAPGASEDRPMSCISWFEAMAFCLWDGGFLPTEAQWHFAASGGADQRAYPWSQPAASTTIDCSLANLGGASWPGTACEAAGTVAVGSRSPMGDNGWGMADLAGNLWEWVFDWHGAYPPCADDCANLTPSAGKVLRGGGFSYTEFAQRAATRSDPGIPPTTRYSDFGVRCARAP